MRKLTYYIAMTLDGVIAGPAGTTDFFMVDGPHQAAINETFADTVPPPWREQLGFGALTRFDTVLMGRQTYDLALAEGNPSPYPHLRQIVASRTARTSTDVEFTADPVATVRELKQRDGLGIWLCAGGKLAGALRDEIDELVLKVQPFVAGGGLRLVDGDFSPARFTLADSQVFDNGVTVLTYRR
ncbi:dihydrofolate reductase family protein [Amycolatopsis suaedae]|uniref:Dihydrofolate reductase n=1 Tax=Amycolatopsis suaedae TaxID=2510978 RepID=A0A4Q7J6Q9_9PSEU|nr:dihydrofolate reductase family protein [Amycolatopsis suaedae]RZQ61694.1 dihydrofolate reductase [Amycolatopsis suaedae]